MFFICRPNPQVILCHISDCYSSNSHIFKRHSQLKVVSSIGTMPMTMTSIKCKKLQTSGMWRHVVWWTGANVSEALSNFISRVEIFFLNAGTYLPNCTVSHPKRPQTPYAPPWELKTPYVNTNTKSTRRKLVRILISEIISSYSFKSLRDAGSPCKGQQWFVL